METPEPLRSFQKFVKEARKVEKNCNLSAGEILFGSTTVNGKKVLHRLAIDTNNYIDSVSKYVIGKV